MIIEEYNNRSEYLKLNAYFIKNLSKSNKDEVMKQMEAEYENYINGDKDALKTLLASSSKTYMTSKIKGDITSILK